MSITLKLVDAIDKLKVQSFFVEKGDKTYFSPIHIGFDANSFENKSDKLFNVNGKPYKKNEFEEQVLKELDF
mgnify:FL=1